MQLDRQKIAQEIAQEQPDVDLREAYKTLLTMMVGMRVNARTADGSIGLLTEAAARIVQRIEACPPEEILQKTWIDFVEEEDGLGKLSLTSQENAYIDAFQNLHTSLRSERVSLTTQSIADAAERMRGAGPATAETANAIQGVQILITRQAVRDKLDAAYRIGESRVGHAEQDNAVQAIRGEINPITAELQRLLGMK